MYDPRTGLTEITTANSNLVIVDNLQRANIHDEDVNVIAVNNPNIIQFNVLATVTVMGTIKDKVSINIDDEYFFDLYFRESAMGYYKFIFDLKDIFQSLVEKQRDDKYVDNFTAIIYDEYYLRKDISITVIAYSDTADEYTEWDFSEYILIDNVFQNREHWWYDNTLANGVPNNCHRATEYGNDGHSAMSMYFAKKTMFLHPAIKENVSGTPVHNSNYNYKLTYYDAIKIFKGYPTTFYFIGYDASGTDVRYKITRCSSYPSSFDSGTQSATVTIHNNIAANSVNVLFMSNGSHIAHEGLLANATIEAFDVWDGGYYDLTISNLNSSGVMVEEHYIRFKTDKKELNNYMLVSDAGVYVRWLNTRGTYSYWLFSDVFDIVKSAKSKGNYNNKRAVDFGSDRISKRNVIAKEVERKIVCGNSNLNIIDKDQLQDLLTAKDVWIYTSRIGTGITDYSAWEKVILGNIEYQEYNTRNNIISGKDTVKVEILLDEQFNHNV